MAISALLLFLPRLARGVFRVARGLLILFELCIGLRSSSTLGFLARLLLRDGARFAGFLSRALRLYLFGGGPVRVLALRRANLARLCRFHLCGLSFGERRVAGLRRCAYLFQLGLLRLDRRLQAFRETGFFSRHVFYPH